MTEEQLKKDILFQIDMQLYSEFNDKFCEINDHLGDVYTYKDLENAEKEINKLKQENEQLKSELGYTGNHIPRID